MNERERGRGNECNDEGEALRSGEVRKSEYKEKYSEREGEMKEKK